MNLIKKSKPENRKHIMCSAIQASSSNVLLPDPLERQLTDPQSYSIDELSQDLSIWDDLLLSRKAKARKNKTSKKTKRQRVSNNGAECGLTAPKTEAFIVNGEESKLNAHPWIVQIFPRNGPVDCGGSIIDQLHILTAAHCLPSPDKASRIRAGVHDENKLTGKEQERKVITKYAHEKFVHTDDSILNDIAILKLDQPLQWTDSVRPICLPESGGMRLQSKSKRARGKKKLKRVKTQTESNELPSPGLNLTVAGWGVMKIDGHSRITPGHLREGRVPVQSKKKCNSWHLEQYQHDTMFCAGHDNSSKVDTCEGDSGGPAMYRNNDKWTVYGITSFGAAECDYGYGVYTRVASYYDWIKDIVKKSY